MAREKKPLSTCQLFHCSIHHRGNLDVRLFGLLFSLSILMNTGIRRILPADRRAAANRCFLARASSIVSDFCEDYFSRRRRVADSSKQISLTSGKVRSVSRSSAADDGQMTCLLVNSTGNEIKSRSEEMIRCSGQTLIVSERKWEPSMFMQIVKTVNVLRSMH